MDYKKLIFEFNNLNYLLEINEKHQLLFVHNNKNYFNFFL